MISKGGLCSTITSKECFPWKESEIDSSCKGYQGSRIMEKGCWAKMSTGLPIKISSSMRNQNYISFCRLDIDIYSVVRTVAIGSSCYDVDIKNITCGPGHGILSYMSCSHLLGVNGLPQDILMVHLCSDGECCKLGTQ